MRGRKGKPLALKTIEGYKDKKRINYDEPTPPKAANIRPPAWIAKEAKKEWKRVADILCRIGVVTEIDYPILVAYCQAWGKFVESEKEIAKTGFLTGRMSAGKSTNPLDWISNKAQDQMLKYAAELGIGASARTRIKAVKEKKDNSGADLI